MRRKGMEILVRRIERSRRVDVAVGLENGFEGGNGGGRWNGEGVVVVVVGCCYPRSGVFMVAVEPEDSGGFGKHLVEGENCREEGGEGGGKAVKEREKREKAF